MVSLGLIMAPRLLTANLCRALSLQDFLLIARKLESVQWILTLSAPEVLQKKPDPLYTNSLNPFLVLPALCRPSQTLALALMYLCVTIVKNLLHVLPYSCFVQPQLHSR